MTYQLVDTALIAENGTSVLDGRIEIRFDNMTIDRVTKTTLWIWNSGNRTIHRSDIAQSDRLRIVLPDDTKILQVKTSSGVIANDVTVSELTSDAIFPSFEFLDPDQGFKCEILHTAPKNTAKVVGTIKGIGHLKNYIVTSVKDNFLPFIGFVTTAFSVLAVSLTIPILLASLISSEYKLTKVFIVIIGFMVIFAFISSILDANQDRIAKKRPPRSLEI